MTTRTATRNTIGALLFAATMSTVGLAAAPTAAAYPVGPWGVEGPCAGRVPAECPMSPSADGLTWGWHGDAWNYDKTGHFVCMSSTVYCAPLMAIVRALPPTPIGSWIPTGS